MLIRSPSFRVVSRLLSALNQSHSFGGALSTAKNRYHILQQQQIRGSRTIWVTPYRNLLHFFWFRLLVSFSCTRSLLLIFFLACVRGKKYYAYLFPCFLEEPSLDPSSLTQMDLCFLVHNRESCKCSTFVFTEAMARWVWWQATPDILSPEISASKKYNPRSFFI